MGCRGGSDRMHQFMTEERKNELNLHLEDCQNRLNALKKNYVPPVTNDLDAPVVDGIKSLRSEEFEYDDAYTDSLEAIRLFVEILQTRSELGGHARRKIITTEKAAEIMLREFKTKEYPLLPQGLIMKQDIVSNYQRDLVVYPVGEQVVEKII